MENSEKPVLEKNDKEKELKLSNLATAATYRAVFAIERSREMSSGMMYRPDEKRLMQSFSDLMQCDDAKKMLSADELVVMEEQIKTIFNSMNEFNEKQLRSGYGTSYPRSPISEMTPNEICRFTSPYGEGGSEPDALVYISDDGKLSYRMNSQLKSESNSNYDERQKIYREGLSKTYDQKNNSPEIKTGIIAELKPIAPEIVEKFSQVLSSNSFKGQWERLERQSDYDPTISLNKATNINPIKQ